ncbi:prepilin peptidase [Virgibacillus pantothenticus]|uniref:Prepilin peptidase n=1 Tax=Virgibacillus pantothenticus TaxID=1473 RepID=A0A0L0QQF9_VIRPA|nr:MULTISPECIES: A24 family peptidase [Virgibacillus]API90839.1 prepilin peptidase [Virgibacillus sp. 6R]KNE20786.1 prepilin peptidase [Virgibacillus pantothenticus]MBS7426726.1 prepilin peptidase [Virgibacillus sp. 19R1-5]MBU8566054.1 prepilin peptidase [Virgibacillus pantothenticus]MBU8602773.1 prepilin peptidase [Virgibacillus pantothenticus]
MEIVAFLFVALCGFVFGSFFVVVGIRLPKRESFVTERSRCPKCCKRLNWFELIPVLSFLCLKRKCGQCNHKISSIYPLMELLTAILFAMSYLIFGWKLELMVALLFSSLLIICLVTDLFYMMIPNRLLLFFLPLFIILRTVEPLEPWWDPFQGALVGLLLPLLVIILSRGGMGMGDMKLFGLLGLVLGTTKLLLCFVLACIIGAVIGVLLIAYQRVSLGKPIPFAPYIVIGAWIAYFNGDNLIDLYITRFITFY